MAKIAIEQLGPGMILDQPVTDLHGRVLLKEGSEISEKSIRILKMWGVLEASVADGTMAAQEQAPVVVIDPALLEHAAVAVSELFRHTNPKSAFLDELRRLSTLRIAREKAKEDQNAQQSA